MHLAVGLAFFLNGIFILTACYRLSYDAYTHMLFADHYRLNWWSLWDPRWFTGFEVTSYPPLIHQVIALISYAIGIDAAFAVVLWAVLAAYPFAMYAFSRVFVGRDAAGYAALGVAVLPSVYLSAHTFGQLPTLTSTLIALLSAAALAEFLISGKRLSGALAVMLIAVVMGAHHATLLLLPWVILAVGLHVLLNHPVKWYSIVLRLAVFGLFAAIVSLLVIWPFWHWGLGQAIQTPIYHPSRDNFFAHWFAPLVFFWSMYGPLVVIIPFALFKGLDRRFFGLAVAFLFLFLLGLGGTTPLPQWLFGSRWEWLTYDRFALWASLILLPFFGTVMAQAQHKFRLKLDPALRIISCLKPTWQEKLRTMSSSLIVPKALMVYFPFLAFLAILVSLYPTFLPTQPKPVNMQPIVAFLEKDDRSQWRYLTFGFGDQFAYLNRLTAATTIDGSYYTARKLPELRTSGIGQIDSVYWLPKGLAALDPILQKSGGHGVRWGFVNNPMYLPVLERNGWVKLTTLTNGIQVWENPKAILPEPSTPPPVDQLESFSWGTLPLLALVLTVALAGLRLYPAPARYLLLGMHSFTVGLLPVGLVFWYFHSLSSLEYPRVYFIYSNAILFISDTLAFIAVFTWAVAHWFGPSLPDENRPKDQSLSRLWSSSSIDRWLFAICGLATLSILWSKNWQVSLYVSLHLWLVFGLFLSLRDRPKTWKTAVIGFCAVLGIQSLIGFWEFAVQSTAFLSPLKLYWPGSIDASVRGASIVQLLEGTRFLRVYGTLPHPNILGTFAVALIAGPLTLYLKSRKHRIGTGLLFCAGLVLLLLTFSRGAWIGLSVGVIVILLKLRHLDYKPLIVLGIVGTLILVAAILPLRALIFTRIGNPSSVPTEEFSIKGRTWLASQAMNMIRLHPVMGGGIGSFVLELARRAPIGYVVEPVHNLPLLVANDLGIGGVIVLVGLCFVILQSVYRACRPETIILSAALLSLLATSLFDHSLWTLSPGRIFLGLMLGLWAGQMKII